MVVMEACKEHVHIDLQHSNCCCNVHSQITLPGAGKGRTNSCSRVALVVAKIDQVVNAGRLGRIIFAVNGYDIIFTQDMLKLHVSWDGGILEMPTYP